VSYALATLELPGVLQYDFMVRALVAGLLVGLAAPVVGIFLVQRRLALIGDGLGHVALAGVAAGVLTGSAPVWTALVAAVVGAVAIELIRARGRTSGDIALAVLFYGGIAGGVVLISLSPAGTPANLNAYLFGAITTTTNADLATFAVLAAVVLLTAFVLARRLFAVSNDPEYARAVGLPVLALNLVLAVLTAVTVVVSMRVVGLLLISALMILPNAVAQLLCHSFRASLVLAVVTGVAVSLAGITTSYYADTPSGGTIVLFAIGVFVLAALGAAARDALARRRHAVAEGHHAHDHGVDCGHPAEPHDDHVDYLHEGHRHAQHAGHYDEH
jgi:zinc transport system permease protein